MTILRAMSSFNRYVYLIYLFIAAGIFNSCDIKQRSNDMNNQFTTWQNPCFDRCASIWLMNNFIDSSAAFRFIEFGKKVTEGIPFDVPGAELGRQRNISCFESIIEKYQVNDPALNEMAKVIHDIDVNKWGMKITRDADSLEIVFNELRNQLKEDQQLLDSSAIIFEEMYQKYSQ